MSPRAAAGGWSGRLLAALGLALLGWLLLPLAALVLSTSPSELLEGLRSPLVWPALRLSLWTASVALLCIVVLGTPLAWILAQRGRAGPWRLAETLVQLPVVVPPSVAGIALLLAFGRQGLLGAALASVGVSVSLSTPAVVIAEVFVAAPFYVLGAAAAFRALDPDVVLLARSLGAGSASLLLRVAIPLAAPGLAAGAALAWARALGEFGATLMFAGNISGRTQTLPLAIYSALDRDLGAARALAVVLCAFALGLLLAVRWLQRSGVVAGVVRSSR